MSGHSKFANIKHKKGKSDAQKAKVFTKLGREIQIAVKSGGPDPETNSKLKDVIVKAKAANMPNDNIQRSIKKASGELNTVNYESMTYELILQRMMNRVSANYPNIDTREGSILFNALAPASLELAIMYTELDNVLSESFVGTATREYLLTACLQMGMDISVFSASNGVHKGVFNVEVPIGSRWNYELYNYAVTEYIGLDENNNHEYRMICETEGLAPNTATGDLTAITYTANDLTYARVTECLVEGEDETSDDDIRSTYYEYVNNTTVDGNIKQYERWCTEYKDENGVRGVGNCKILPLWNGDNTVKVSILSASNGIASDELVADLQEYFDPNCEGMGNGVAPIGAFVTVSTASEVKINITADITMQSTYTDTSVIDKALTEYFSNISYEKNKIAYMNIGAVILGVDGVESLNNLSINGDVSDITLGDEEIPVLGTTQWVVS